jgi:hypothetical protein
MDLSEVRLQLALLPRLTALVRLYFGLITSSLMLLYLWDTAGAIAALRL